MTPAARETVSRRALLWILAAFLFTAVYFTGVFPPFANPNELSRFEAVVAFVETGGFAIDGVLERLGRHEDVAAAGGRLYSNKAPGLSLAAIPVYWALDLFLPAPSRGTSDAIFVLLRLLTVSLVSTIALWRLGRRIGSSSAASLVLFAVAFGTPFLFYARSFFAHAWSASLLFLAWDRWKASEEDPIGRRASVSRIAAGLLAGLAAISEYTVAPVALLLAIRALTPRPARALVFVAGAAVPLVLLGAYNAACFGSPFVLSSAREAHPAYAGLIREGLFGFGPPSLAVAAKYLFHPARGLLLFSPFWLWLVPGFLRWWRSRQERPDCLLALAAVVLHFVLLTGYRNWHGGWSLGNRYLLPVVFFAALALPRALESPLARGLFAAAVAFAAANFFLMTASFPHFPPDIAWPPGNGGAWFLTRGWVAPNLLGFLGPVSLLLPLAAAAGAFAGAFRCARPLVPRARVAVPAGVALALIAAMRPPEPSFNASLCPAAVYGAYSGLDPERRELRAVVLSASSPEEQRRAAGAWRLYGPR